MPELVEALYAYSPQSPEDLELRPGNRIEVQQHLSSDWARGKNLDSGKEGVFPKNYVKPVDQGSRGDFNRPAAAIPQNSGPQPFDEKQSYVPPPPTWQQQQQPPQYDQYHPPQQYQPPQQQYQPPQQQYQPPQQQYQPPPQQFQQQPEPQAQPQAQHHQHRFGGLARRFGDSVMFGAGATLGSDIINKIF